MSVPSTRIMMRMCAGVRMPSYRIARPMMATIPRSLHMTAIQRASEDNETKPNTNVDSKVDSKVDSEADNSSSSVPEGMEKVHESPGALSAIRNLMEVLKQNGMDFSKGEKPSMMMLARLATKSDVRQATSKVVEELKNAGIELTPDRLQHLIKGDFLKK
ncbi:hypothetical protein MYAM1_003754 [Malassezia yamatoensis]|uniref:Uncharacterized protein n=1 Tax=Malassezia yamatoensis TaxID=253288 RepID=A0AAJ6CJP0_9BASI|nr:hypothetical protein MYAM1_003754 [Malassezia yamatoensis]